MPWGNQGGGGGGPWGSGGGGGGQNPWGRGGPSQADLEDMLRRGQDRFRQALPRGFGGGRGILLLIGIAILIWLATGIYRVQPDQLGIVQRFGAYVRTEQPGLRYHLPAPIETVTKPAVTALNRIDVGMPNQAVEGRTTAGARDASEAESLMLTGDENIIDIDFTVLWRIADPVAFLFNIRDPAVTVKIAAESAMREIIGQTEIQPALNEARDEIAQGTRTKLQEILDSYGAGIAIEEVQLQKVAPPQQVIDAFDNVLRARQDQARLRNEAEAYRNDIIPRARGDSERLRQEAAAYREQVIAEAVGDASRFTSVLASYRLAPEITAQRFYLETLQDVFHGTTKIIIDQAASGSGVVPYLPLDQLGRRAPMPAPTPSAPGGQ